MTYIELNRFLNSYVLSHNMHYYFNLNTLDNTTELIIKI